MKTIKALTSFGGPDAGRKNKLVLMREGDVQEVSDEFAADVIRAGQAETAKSKPKARAAQGGTSIND
jgi:hypothetical protein